MKPLAELVLPAFVSLQATVPAMVAGPCFDGGEHRGVTLQETRNDHQEHDLFMVRRPRR
jgi:hypothetical protein